MLVEVSRKSACSPSSPILATHNLKLKMTNLSKFQVLLEWFVVTLPGCSLRLISLRQHSDDFTMWHFAGFVSARTSVKNSILHFAVLVWILAWVKRFNIEL